MTTILIILFFAGLYAILRAISAMREAQQRRNRLRRVAVRVAIRNADWPQW